MTKLEELKAAYAAATPGEWEQVGYDDIGRYIQTLANGEIFSLRRGKFKQIGGLEYRFNADFIALAHNLMPQLLEAVELLKQSTDLAEVSIESDEDDEIKASDEALIATSRLLLEKLK